MDLNFDLIDFSKLSVSDSEKASEKANKDKNCVKPKEKYDKTTTEIYRTKRLFKIDPLIDTEIPQHLIFEYKYRWDPYTGEVLDEDPIGPLCFNAITLYDFIFANRYKGLWNPPNDGFQGFYGDLVGSGIKMEVKSRGENAEKYVFRLPIIDCYLPPEHNLSFITMGPILTDEDLDKIDQIVKKYHKNKNYITELKKIKNLYDYAILNDISDPEFIKHKEKINANFTEKEMLESFNRQYVDKLVKLRN